MHNILNCKYDNIPNILIMRGIANYTIGMWHFLPHFSD